MYEGLTAEYLARTEIWVRDNDPGRARRAIQRRELELLSLGDGNPRLGLARRLSALFTRGGSVRVPRQTPSHA